MDSFLQKYILLANKNSPIIISKGKYITDNIFNKQLCKQDIDMVINKLGSVSGIKMKITHVQSVITYKTGNISITQHNRNMDHNIVNIQDYYSAPNMYIQILNVTKDQYIIPSISNYNAINTDDIMNININNNIDIQICDNNSFYTIDIVLKKPVTYSILLPIINAIF
tara:strand:- start:731 stop:1234 length:504 start_codon:yes stop_codon:yes gene_type:complete